MKTLIYTLAILSSLTLATAARASGSSADEERNIANVTTPYDETVDCEILPGDHCDAHYVCVAKHVKLGTKFMAFGRSEYWTAMKAIRVCEKKLGEACASLGCKELY